MLSHSSKNKSFLATAFPLLLILFIDGMGLGLILPLLSILLDPKTGFLTDQWAIQFHNLIFGSILGFFMLFWFFGAAIMGDLSDQIGRRKSLLVCLIGTFFGYVLLALSVSAHSFLLLLGGRIIAGLTAGSQPIAQAAIIDLSTPEQKTKNIALVLTALSLGFILGPLLGGLLSNNQIVSWFNLATPFYFAALLSLINIIFLYFLFKETFFERKQIQLRFSRAFEIFISAFQHQKIRYLSMIFFVFILGWSTFYSFISIFLIKEYNFTPTDISLFMAIMGVGFAFGNAFIVGIFEKIFSLANGVIITTLVAAIFVVITISTHSSLWAWLLVGPIGAVVTVIYANSLALLSGQASLTEQGWIMGVSSSIMALVWAIDCLFIGLLATWSVEWSLLLTVICFVITAILMFVINKTKLAHD